jgi:hypothetical protein
MPYGRVVRCKVATLCVATALVTTGCGTSTRQTQPTIPSSTATSATESSSTTSAPPAAVETTIAPATTAPLVDPSCSEVGAKGTPAPATYAEASFDRFGPLEPTPSLTINVAKGEGAGAALTPRASRVEGGLLVTARWSSVSATPSAPGASLDPMPVTAVDHDGTVRWSRCLDGNVTAVIVAAPEHRPANALVSVETTIGGDVSNRWVQLSLRTGTEHTTFATAMASAGITADLIARLIVVDVDDRYALLADSWFDDAELLIRYDLVDDVATNVGPPSEMQDLTPGICGVQPQYSLADSGDVIVTNGTVQGGSAVVAIWRDGPWSRDTSQLADVVGVRVAYDCTNEPGKVPNTLLGIDALGQVVWTNSELSLPNLEGIGFYVDDAVTVTQVCSHQDSTGVCNAHELVGINQTTGEVLWTRPGLRLVAGDPADGYVLARSGDLLNGSTPGWEMIDDSNGRSVPGQQWDDPAAFNRPCCADENSTVRAGGLVIVVDGEQIRVWYPAGAGGIPRTVTLDSV